MTKIKNILVVGVLVLLAAGIFTAVSAQSGDEYYEVATGHYIRGLFWKYYQAQGDASKIEFAFPITDEFTDPVISTRMQYFQRGRLEQVNTPEGVKVIRSKLGSLLYNEKDPRANFPRDEINCRRFPGDIFVCFAFLQYYDTYNGATLLGLPVGEAQDLNGRTVQYFEYGRLEWWPNNLVGSKVVLSDLGRIYYDQVVKSPERLRPVFPLDVVFTPLQPQVHVFANRALIGVGEQQTLYVVVLDRFYKPVDKAQVELTFLLPNGTKTSAWPDDTNADGISIYSFKVDNYSQQDMIQVQAKIRSAQSEEATGSTWFRIWW